MIRPTKHDDGGPPSQLWVDCTMQLATRNNFEGAQCHDHIVVIFNGIEVVKVIWELPVARVVDIGADGDGI